MERQPYFRPSSDQDKEGGGVRASSANSGGSNERPSFIRSDSSERRQMIQQYQMHGNMSGY